MKTYKFRGRDLDTGEFVFGYFVRGGNKKPYILVDNPNNNGQSLYPVAPDSVAQLVGIDDNGAEIYEGDTVANYCGDILTVSIHTFPACFSGLKLKE